MVWLLYLKKKQTKINNPGINFINNYYNRLCVLYTFIHLINISLAERKI